MSRYDVNICTGCISIQVIISPSFHVSLYKGENVKKYHMNHLLDKMPGFPRIDELLPSNGVEIDHFGGNLTMNFPAIICCGKVLL